MSSLKELKESLGAFFLSALEGSEPVVWGVARGNKNAALMKWRLRLSYSFPKFWRDFLRYIEIQIEHFMNPRQFPLRGSPLEDDYKEHLQ